MQSQDYVSVYYSKLKTLLDELMNYESIPSCTCGGMKTVIQNQQRDWVLKFLMGLNDSYREIKAQILLIKPFPSLNEIYSLVQQEEKRQEISNPGPVNSDSMVFLSRRNFKEGGNQNFSSQKKDKYYCTYCKITGHSLERCFKANPNRPVCSYCQMLGHSEDKCYKLHGFPPGHRSNDKGKFAANMVHSGTAPNQEVVKDKDQVTLSQEKYCQLMALLRPATNLQSSISSSNNVRPLANSFPSDDFKHKLSGTSLSLTTFHHNHGSISETPWIIDTGATDHMICSTSFFASVQANVTYSMVLPNGEYIPVTHVGTVKISESITLSNVLCIPSFTFNLISAKKLAQSLNCCLVFFSNYCYI